MAKQGQAKAPATNLLTDELILEALGARVVYTLPNLEPRYALIVGFGSNDPARANLYVFCDGTRDAAFFGGKHGIEYVADAMKDAGEEERPLPGCWRFAADSPLVARWPKAS